MKPEIVFTKAPIFRSLVRLSAPGILLVVFQSAISIGDTYFVGRLGTAPLAGLALVFPLVMLLQMTSAGAMGGGVSSAIARSLGAGDPALRVESCPQRRGVSRRRHCGGHNLAGRAAQHANARGRPCHTRYQVAGVARAEPRAGSSTFRCTYPCRG